MRSKGTSSGFLGSILVILTAILIALVFPILEQRALSAENAPPVEKPASERWAKDLEGFHQRDATNPPPAGCVLFLGSSSFRMWSDLESRFARVHGVNRGFGGSHASDCVELFEELTGRIQPRQVLLYEGDNDIAASKSPERVLEDLKRLVGLLRKKYPRAYIGFVTIKPSPSRWHLADRVRRVNESMREWIRTQKRVDYIDIFTPMLSGNGQPIEELFLADRLHMNPIGYDILAKRIQPFLR